MEDNIIIIFTRDDKQYKIQGETMITRIGEESFISPRPDLFKFIEQLATEESRKISVISSLHSCEKKLLFTVDRNEKIGNIIIKFLNYPSFNECNLLSDININDTRYVSDSNFDFNSKIGSFDVLNLNYCNHEKEEKYLVNNHNFAKWLKMNGNEELYLKIKPFITHYPIITSEIEEQQIKPNNFESLLNKFEMLPANIDYSNATISEDGTVLTLKTRYGKMIFKRPIEEI